jgi:hypothetical protein
VTDTGGAIQSGTTVVSVSRVTNVITLSLAPTSSLTEGVTFQNNPHALYASGHAARYTATVNAATPGSGTPTGTVTFTITPTVGSPIACSNGSTPPVSRSGVATCVVAPGQLVASDAPFTVSAVYSGDLSYGGNSASASQGIQPLSSKTYVAGNPMPPLHGTSVHFTASVIPSLVGVTPTGTVTFVFTSQPITVRGCTLTLSGPTGKVSGCPIPLADLQVGDVVTDTTTPTNIPSGTTVSVIGTNAVTLSQAPIAATGQTIVFTPASTPTITCDGASNAIALTASGATCTLTGGLPQAGSPFDVVAAYSGDTNDGASTSHALFTKVH